MGRRRRRVIKVVKKKLPSVFTCPSCGEEAIRVATKRGADRASIQCGVCALKQEVEVIPGTQIVDIYCKFADTFYGKNLQTTQVQAPAEPGKPTPQTQEREPGVQEFTAITPTQQSPIVEETPKPVATAETKEKPRAPETGAQ